MEDLSEPRSPNMDKFDRILQLHTILRSRRTPIPLEDLLARLECSRPTLFRTIAVLKDMLVTDRKVSPQRIVHYRETWYLDAWDDEKDALRSFSIDRIRKVKELGEQALDVTEKDLDEHYASAYGIFGGKADKVAVLVFTAEKARWVADEVWHPQQKNKWLEDGRYELTIPYRESRELVMDILRHGCAVEVMDPERLREDVAREVRAMHELYNKESADP